MEVNPMLKTKCEVCGGEVRYTGARWHQSCQPPCVVCGRPVRRWSDSTGTNIHYSCQVKRGQTR